jgi:hypothetical protein
LKNQALRRVLRNSFLAAPLHFGKFARNTFRVPVVAPAGSEPWGWQLLRFTNFHFSEALHGRPGLRSKVVEPVAGAMDNREKGTIVKDIAITASAFGVGTGAPFAVFRSGKERRGVMSSKKYTDER